MSQEQFELSIRGGMPKEVAERITNTRFEINDQVYFRDSPPHQNAGFKCFELNLVYADKHLNYTLGTRAQNNKHKEQIITEPLNNKDGIYASEARSRQNAPMAEKHLSFNDIATMLCERFHLDRTQNDNISKQITLESSEKLLVAREITQRYKAEMPQDEPTSTAESNMEGFQKP